MTSGPSAQTQRASLAIETAATRRPSGANCATVPADDAIFAVPAEYGETTIDKSLAEAGWFE